jgi:hypothetical protein
MQNNPYSPPVAGEDEGGELVTYSIARMNFIEDQMVDDNTQAGAEPDHGRHYRRDRSGSKKRESKTTNRKKAKAASKARKAQR